MNIPLLVWLAILIGLLLLAAGLALWQLRGAAADLARRAALLARTRQLSREFSALARRQPTNPGEPYASRLARLGKSIRRGWEQNKRTEARLARAQSQPAFEPAWRLALIVPLMGELVSRLRIWLETAWLERQAAAAEKVLAEAAHLQEEMAGLGKQEQAAVTRLRQDAQALQGELDGHRLAAALVVEREKLVKVAAELDLAAGKLDAAAGEPTRAQVVEIYPLRVQAEQELKGIRQAMHGHESSHERLRPRMARQRERLEAYEQALASDEERRPAPKLHERSAAAHQALTDLEEALARGEYNAIEPGLTELAARQKELEENLKKLSGLRSRLGAAQEQTSAALTSLRQWMRLYPAPFVLDTAQEQVQALQSKLQEQARTAGSEEPAELEAASLVALDELRKSQSSFEHSLEIYQRLAPLLTAEAIEGLQKRGEHLAARLKLRHASYQEKARLSTLEEHLARLTEGWKRVQGADPDRQSDLTRLGPVMQQVESSWNQLERDTQRAFEALEQAKAAQERALARLEEEVFSELVALAQMEGTEWAAEARRLMEQRQPLVERAGHGNEDFAAVLTETEALLKEAAKLTHEYQFRMARAQTETTRLVDILNSLADRLDRLEQHPYLDFGERVGGHLDALRRWLGQAQTPAQTGLERWAGLAEHGAQLRQEAEVLCRSMEAEAAAADQERAWTEDMLVTAEEYLGGARQQQPPNAFNGELTSARSLLETARRKLSALASPRRKYLLDEYQAELADVRQMITGARGHVDKVLG